MFTNATERAKELAYAATLARRWSCDTIVVVGTAQVQGAPAVSATLLGAGGEVIRRGLVGIPEADDGKLRSLARFVIDGTPSREITVVTSPDAPIVSAGGHSSLVGKLLIGGGLAALTAGVVLIAVDQDPGHKDAQGNQTPSYWQTAPFGIGFGVVGLASAGAGVWFLLRTEHGASTPVVSLGRSGGVIGWSGNF